MGMRLVRWPSALWGYALQGSTPACPEMEHAGEWCYPADMSLSLHSHEAFTEFHLQLDGVNTWQTPAQTFVAKPGSLFAVSPGCRHALLNRPPSVRHFCYAGFRMNTILERNSDLAERYPEFSCLLVEHADALTTPFRMLIREARVSSEFQGEKLRLMLEYLVFSIVPFLTHDDPKRDSPMPAAIEEAKWMLEERPEKEWKVDELAKVVCLAPKYFSSLFARHVGVPPYQFVLQQRIYRAQDLLRDENLPVGEVAHQLGFSSIRRFTSSFKKFAGTTPSAWRKSREKAAGGRTA